MPFGRARAEAAARQVRVIEAEGPDEVRAYALESLIEALTWIGESKQALVPFVKLLRWWDAHPEFFDAGDQNILFWEFGWIVNDMCRDPEVPMARVDRTLDDMERRFSLADRGLERVWSCRLDWELLRCGPKLDQTFATWLTMPVDEEDSCPACHQEHHADYLLQCGDLTGAVAVLEAALASDVSCSREPASMLAMLAWCYLELGQMDDAERILPQATAEIRAATSMSVLVAHSRLFEVYARGGQADHALGLMEKIVEGMAVATPYVRLETWRHVLAGIRCLADGDRPVELSGLPVETVAGLAEYAEAEARALTEAFDTRHGNTAQADRLQRSLTAGPAVRPLVLGVVQPVAPKQVNHVADLADPAKTIAPADTTWARAEAQFAAGNHEAAAILYRRAGDEAQNAGLLSQAGWCWAEAARNWQELGRRDSAAHDYVKAQARLKAAGTDLEEITAMFVAWAPAVQKEDYRTFVDLALADYPTPAQAGSSPIEDILPIALEAGLAASALIRKYVLARAELRDAVARVMARWGGAADRRTALGMAEESASRFSALGRTDDAAHAWWLAGKVAARLRDDSADTNFMMAIQGFKSTGRRNRRFCEQVAVEYAHHLVATGRPHQAGELLIPWQGDE